MRGGGDPAIGGEIGVAVWTECSFVVNDSGGDSQRPSKQPLRWNFRQAIFVNMKGTGEPSFELDFPPGSDMIGSIPKGPKAAERIEFELFSRLAAEVDLTR
jgi:hypothetical protein